MPEISPASNDPAPRPLASALAAAARFVSGVRVRWLDCRPDARQRIYFADHTSHLDALVLWASMPAAVRASGRWPPGNTGTAPRDADTSRRGCSAPS